MPGHFEEFEFTSQDIDRPLIARAFVPEYFTRRTGLVALVHGWGAARDEQDHLAGFFEARDLLALQIGYRDSGYDSEMGRKTGIGWRIPYEFGKLQAIDTLRAVRKALARYQINRHRLFLVGGSGGGHNVLQAMSFAPNTFALTVGLAPASRPTNQDDVEDGGYITDATPGRYRTLGFDFDNGWGLQGVALGLDAEFSQEEIDIRNCQRPEHVAVVRCKVTLIAGANDNLLSPRHSIDMAVALVNAGKQVELHVLDGVNHGIEFEGMPGYFPTMKILEEYVASDLITMETDGNTDFDRHDTIHLGNWRVTYEDGIPELTGPSG